MELGLFCPGAIIVTGLMGLLLAGPVGESNEKS